MSMESVVTALAVVGMAAVVFVILRTGKGGG